GQGPGRPRGRAAAPDRRSATAPRHGRGRPPHGLGRRRVLAGPAGREHRGHLPQMAGGKAGMSNAPNVPVLMYHHVTPAGGMIAVTPEVFEQQIAGLARAGYTSLGTAQLAEYLAGGQVPEKSVLITFDDGYLNNWIYAHPVLQRHGMKAVLFLVTGWAGDGPVRPHAGQAGPLPASPDHHATKRLIAEGRADEVIVRWSEAQAMVAAGTFEVHSHTHTHTRWDKQCGPDVAAKRE